MHNERIQSLDSLRGLAALSVFLGHMWLINRPYDELLRPWFFFCAGKEAVILFFVLSGFVLSLSNRNTPLSFKKYALKRFFRIYPAYYLSICVALVLYFTFKMAPLDGYSIWFNGLLPSTDVSLKTLSHAFFLITKPRCEINGVAWSLTYEVLISVFILPMMWRLNTKQLLIMPIFYCLLWLGAGYSPVTIPAIVQGVFYNTVFFYLGVLASRRAELLVAMSKSILIPVYLMCYASLFFSSNNPIFAVNYVRDGLAAMGSLGLIAVSMNNKSVISLLKLKMFQFYGKISYSFYLFHLVVMYFMIYAFKKALSLLVIKSLIFVVTSLISYGIYRYVEKPLTTRGVQFVLRLNGNVRLRFNAVAQ